VTHLFPWPASGRTSRENMNGGDGDDDEQMAPAPVPFSIPSYATRYLDDHTVWQWPPSNAIRNDNVTCNITTSSTLIPCNAPEDEVQGTSEPQIDHLNILYSSNHKLFRSRTVTSPSVSHSTTISPFHNVHRRTKSFSLAENAHVDLLW